MERQAVGDGWSRRVLIISHDRIGRQMAGPAIRYWEIARALSSHSRVTLIAPQPIDLAAPSLTVGHYTWGAAASLEPWLTDAGAVVANGFVLSAHPEVGRIGQRLALDMYDPILLENLELYRTMPVPQRRAKHRQDVDLLSLQLAAGGFFLCATERQRDLYLGALMAAGRITPETTDADPTLRNLIDVVPFGLPAEPPVKQHRVLRGVIEGIGADDTIILWTGGLWDWLDPVTIVRAMPAVAARAPRARLVFLAGRHPGDVPAMRAHGEATAVANELGLLNRQVFFYEQWIPYDQRADYLLEADIGVTLHRNHLETAYAAVRSRFLDHLWAGLPTVASDGDAAAELVRRHGLGRIVRPGHVRDVTEALIDLIAADDERRACGERARALAVDWTWQRCIGPLAAWCEAQPNLASGATYRPPDEESSRMPAVDDISGEEAGGDVERNAILAALDVYWHVEEPRVGHGRFAFLRAFLVRQLVRPFVVPLLHLQNTYNAAVAKAISALAESSDRRRSSMVQRSGQIEERQRRLEARIEEMQEHIVAINQHVLDLDDADTTLAELLLGGDPEASRETTEMV